MQADTRPETTRPGNEPAEPQDAAAWLREHGVTLAALSLIAVQLLWLATLLSRCYLRQDDFWNFDRALADGFTWHYLMGVNVGHMAPLGFAMSWVLAHVAVYNWALMGAVILAMVAGACLALLRLLRTLFGNRPGILIPLAVYLFCPLALAAVSWWSVAVQTLPLEVSLFMTTDAHVRYLRGGQRRHAVAAAGWLLLGLVTVQRGVLIPLLLFAITAAFFVEGRWLSAAAVTALRYWRLWLVYGAMMAGYCVLFFIGLQSSATQPSAPGTAGRVFSFIGTLTGTTLVPGTLGGPWAWSALSDGSAQAKPVPLLQQLAWGLALLLVIASCAYRIRAWRAWAILAGWIAVADLVPPIIGRLGGADPTLLGLQARYVTDAVSVLAVCLGLAFFPVAGAPGGYRFQLSPATATPALRAAAVSVRAGCAVLFAAFLTGSFWSLQALEGATHTLVARSYIYTAGLALQQAPPGTQIIDGPTPSTIMAPIFFGTAGATSRVLGVLASPDRHLRWTQAPAGVVAHVMQFDPYGRLQPDDLAGLSASPPHGQRCWTVTSAGTTIPLPRPLFRWGWTVRLDYSGPAAAVAVGLGNGHARAALPAGTHSFYVPLTGSGRDVSVSLLSPAAAGCLTGVTVGTWQPGPPTSAIPYIPVPG